MAEMSDLDWEALHENFDTAELLRAVILDALRGHLNDREHFQPPEIRGELLKLHGLAMESYRRRSARRRGGNVRPGGGFGGANRSDDGGDGTNRRTLEKLTSLRPKSLDDARSDQP